MQPLRLPDSHQEQVRAFQNGLARNHFEKPKQQFPLNRPEKNNPDVGGEESRNGSILTPD